MPKNSQSTLVLSSFNRLAIHILLGFFAVGDKGAPQNIQVDPSLKTTFSVCMGKFDAENRPFKLPQIRCKQTGYGFIYGSDQIRCTLSEGFIMDIGLYLWFFNH